MEVFGVLVHVGARKYCDMLHVLLAFTAEYLAPNILLPVSPISIVSPARSNTWRQTDIQCEREKSRGIKINIMRPTVSKITFVN